MAKFKPGFWYNAPQSKNVHVEFGTYAELKRNIKSYLQESAEQYISVHRSRRGNWGEWFEHWVLGSDGRPKIIKEGWQ